MIFAGNEFLHLATCGSVVLLTAVNSSYAQCENETGRCITANVGLAMAQRSLERTSFSSKVAAIDKS